MTKSNFHFYVIIAQQIVLRNGKIPMQAFCIGHIFFRLPRECPRVERSDLGSVVDSKKQQKQPVFV
jgi:hypothetical protein